MSRQMFKEMSLDELADILSLTVKHDKENKIVTFFGDAVSIHRFKPNQH